MPRFFFDIHEGEAHTRDEQGKEFATREAARDEAITTLPNIARDALPYGDQRSFTLDMRDEAGKVIFTATLSFMARWIE